MLGNGRLEAQCFDGIKRLSHIRGKLRKKVGNSELNHFEGGLAFMFSINTKLET